jgi:3-phenylpropionate/cinnamic acid dioxygenase small subunit
MRELLSTQCFVQSGKSSDKAQLKHQMNRLELEMAVNRLNMSYAQCIDDDRLEEWPALFGNPCFYGITTRDNYAQGLPGSIIYCDSQGMLKDRISALREANIYERQRYRHIVSMPARLCMNDGVIASETAFVIYRTIRNGRTDVFATGCYYDDLVPNATGELKFARREVVCDSSVFDTLLAIPL